MAMVQRGGGDFPRAQALDPKLCVKSLKGCLFFKAGLSLVGKQHESGNPKLAKKKSLKTNSTVTEPSCPRSTSFKNCKLHDKLRIERNCSSRPIAPQITTNPIER